MKTVRSGCGWLRGSIGDVKKCFKMKNMDKECKRGTWRDWKEMSTEAKIGCSS